MSCVAFSLASTTASSLPNHQIHVIDRRSMALRRTFTPQLQFQRHVRQQTTRDCLVVAQPGRKCPYAVVASGAKDEGTQIIIVTDFHVQSAIGLAQTTFTKLAQRRGPGMAKTALLIASSAYRRRRYRHTWAAHFCGRTWCIQPSD